MRNWVPNWREEQKEWRKIFEEITAENFSNLGKERGIQDQEVQRVPNKGNPKRPTPRYFLIKKAKVKGQERILKGAGESNYFGTVEIP